MWLEGETHIDLDYVSRAEDRRERIKIGFDEVNLNGKLNGSVFFFNVGTGRLQLILLSLDKSEAH